MKDNCLRAKLLCQFYPSYSLLYFPSSPGPKHYMHTYHGQNHLGVLRSVTAQWGMQTV